MLISRNLHNKNSEVSIITRSPTASLSFKGQVTKHTTVKRSIECLFVLPLVVPWFDKPKEDIKVSMEMGDKVSFKCGAKGFPLEVEWRLETHRKSSIQPFSCISKGDNYENQNPLRHRFVRRRQ